MSVIRYQEQAEADMSIIKMYLGGLEMSESTKEGILRTIKRYARQEVYLAFAKQAEAVKRLERLELEEELS